MARIDITPSAFAALVSILDRRIPGREVRAIGSRVTRRAKPFSDLDLVVMGDRPMDLATLAELRDELDESSLPFTVDLIEWATASPSFRRLIELQAVDLRTSVPAEAPISA